MNPLIEARVRPMMDRRRGMADVGFQFSVFSIFALALQAFEPCVFGRQTVPAESRKGCSCPNSAIPSRHGTNLGLLLPPKPYHPPDLPTL